MSVKKTCALLIIIFIFGYPGCTKKNEKKIVIGSKNFTEQVILGEMISILLEKKTDLNVERKLNLGGTFICFEALKHGDIDLYVEYTGTGLTAILNMEVMSGPQKVYNLVKEAYRKRFNLVWLEPLGFNNTYTLTMRGKQAEGYNIKTISDLAAWKDKLIAGFTHEFSERPDGYPNLIEHYGFEFAQKPREMDPGLMYIAIANEEVDIICGFATDGRILAFHLVTLEDDKNFFPPYYAAPVIRQQTLDKYPEIARVLNQLGGKIDDNTMVKMNYEVDEKGREPKKVATQFLHSIDLL